MATDTLPPSGTAPITPQNNSFWQRGLDKSKNVLNKAWMAGAIAAAWYTAKRQQSKQKKNITGVSRGRGGFFDPSLLNPVDHAVNPGCDTLIILGLIFYFIDKWMFGFTARSPLFIALNVLIAIIAFVLVFQGNPKSIGMIIFAFLLYLGVLDWIGWIMPNFSISIPIPFFNGAIPFSKKILVKYVFSVGARMYWPFWVYLGAFTNPILPIRRKGVSFAGIVATFFWLFWIWMLLTPIVSGATKVSDVLTAGQDETTEIAEGVKEQESYSQANWRRVKECWQGYREGDEKKKEECSKIGAPPDVDKENKTLEGIQDQTKESSITVTLLPGDNDPIYPRQNMEGNFKNVEIESRFYITTIKEEITAELSCEIQDSKDEKNYNSGDIVKPASKKITIRKYQDVEEGVSVMCSPTVKRLKEGKNKVKFKALMRELESNTRYTNFFIQETERVEKLEEVKDRTYQNARDRCLENEDIACLESLNRNLYLNVKDFNTIIRTEYPDGVMKSKVGPEFATVIIETKNPPIIGINDKESSPYVKSGATFDFKISVENKLSNGKIIDIQDVFVDFPFWLQPREGRCEFIDQSSKEEYGEEGIIRNKYKVKKNVLENIQWKEVKKGNNNQQRVGYSCELEVVIDDKLSDILPAPSDLNPKDIKAQIIYSYEIEKEFLINVVEDTKGEKYSCPVTNYKKIITNEEFTDTKSISLDNIKTLLKEKGSILDDSAAKVIYDEAIRGGINPLLLIVTLQKEQNLITVPPKGEDYALKWATGCGIPEDAERNKEHEGFENQIKCAINTYKKWYGRCGENEMMDLLGEPDLEVSNKASCALFKYTPHTSANCNFRVIWDEYKEYFETINSQQVASK